MVNTTRIIKYLNIDFFQINREDTQKYCESLQVRPNKRFYGGHWLAEFSGSAMLERVSWPLGSLRWIKVVDPQNVKLTNAAISRFANICVYNVDMVLLCQYTDVLDNTQLLSFYLFFMIQKCYYWLMLGIVFEFVYCIWLAHDLHTNTGIFFWMLLQKKSICGIRWKLANNTKNGGK